MKGLREKSFNFSKATNDIVLRSIQKLNTKKASQLNYIPTKYIKKFSDVFTPVKLMTIIIVSPLVFFRNVLKLLKSSLHIRRTNLQKKLTTRQFSILSSISKIYERLMHGNMSDYFNVLSKFQCGFRKGFGAQNCLLYMVETIRKSCDNQEVFAAVMTGFSKAFDCISHELLIAKRNAYGLMKLH